MDSTGGGEGDQGKSDHSPICRAYASEWLAYYQYWLGAKLASGIAKGDVARELADHAQSEYGHAGLLADRIIQLGGVPLTNPNAWLAMSPCPFDAPANPSTTVLLDQNIRGEQCAIDAYKKILDVTRETDDVTYDLVLNILKDELEHEEDLQRLMTDINVTKMSR